MKKDLVTILALLLQSIMLFGQSDTLSYESIMDYYNRKTNMIEFYQTAGNNDKAIELTRERAGYIDALGDNYGKGLFYSALSDEYNELGDYINATLLCRKATNIYKKVLGSYHFSYIVSLCKVVSTDFFIVIPRYLLLYMIIVLVLCL